MFDTHCHLNFSAFKKNLHDVVKQAHAVGVEEIVIPGTDLLSSQKAFEIASQYKGIYAAVGIHPHHVYELKLKDIQHEGESSQPEMVEELQQLEKLLEQEKVVAVGEVGVDRHVYTQTKYEGYTVDDNFIQSQKKVLAQQIKLAIQYEKSLIIHNREAKKDLFEVIRTSWNSSLEGRSVLHCCEPDPELLTFAKEHKLFLGVDGDVTFSKEKQDFLKSIEKEEFLSRYVLETDAPFLLPEPLRTQKKYPNKPENIQTIAVFLAELLSIDITILKQRTTENAHKLFDLS